MENEVKKERVTWVRPQDLTLDNARTEYCKMIDLFLHENEAAGKLLTINKDLTAQVERLTQEVKNLKSPGGKTQATGGS